MILLIHHLAGDLHIHLLEYLGPCPYRHWDLRYFFYYGLISWPGNQGQRRRSELRVAILTVKALDSDNFAGGQGFYNFLTFIAPLGLEYDEIKQLMQMFVYQMTQMMVAKGGQLVFSSVQSGIPKLWRDKPAVRQGVDGRLRPQDYGCFASELWQV